MPSETRGPFSCRGGGEPTPCSRSNSNPSASATPPNASAAPGPPSETGPPAAHPPVPPSSTVRAWPSRYNARLIGRIGRPAFYDYWDLATIDALKNLGLPIPPTPEERDTWRAEQRRLARAS